MIRDETNGLVYEGQAPDDAQASTTPPEETTTALLALKNYAGRAADAHCDPWA